MQVIVRVPRSFANASRRLLRTLFVTPALARAIEGDAPEDVGPDCFFALFTVVDREALRAPQYRREVEDYAMDVIEQQMAASPV